MTDYQNIVKIEESVEVFPNQTPQPTSKSVSSSQINGLFVAEPDSVHHRPDSDIECPLNQGGSSTDDFMSTQKRIESKSSSRTTLSDPFSSTNLAPIRRCDDIIHEAVDMSVPAILQNKIQSLPRTSSAEKVSKCNICEYRNSIEKWRFPDGLICCPECLHFEAPLLRTKVRKVKRFLRSALCANCLLYCWPLCFVPYLTMPPPQNYLHCPQCFTFLGMYDERKKCIQPNREYVESNGCFSAEETQRKAKQQEQERWKENMFMRQIY